MPERRAAGPRCAALIGPYSSGKTTLLENILHASGATQRRGTVKEGNLVGDSSAESRHRQMSTEVNVASADFMGEAWTFLDCPGSIELLQETYNALMVADVAVLVVEPVPDRARAIAPLLKFLDEREIPHMIFVNKLDHASAPVRQVLEALQTVSERPLVLRQVPIVAGDQVTGYVDLVSERAYSYKPGQASDLIAVPDAEKDSEKDARQKLLEALADFDDGLLEKLLEDSVPPTGDIYAHLTKNLQNDRIVPVFMGAVEKGSGVRRLLKALRHETPEVRSAAARLGVDAARGEALAQVFKSQHVPHSGKLTFVRVLRGELADGAAMGGERIGGIFRVTGAQHAKLPKAQAGMVVALGRMESIKTGPGADPIGQGAGRHGRIAEAAEARLWPNVVGREPE